MPLDSPSDSSHQLESLEALGHLLQETREARGLSIIEASNDTFVRTQYLEALEHGDLTQLPELVYVRGFLRRYADYLGLNSDRILEQSTALFSTQAPPASISTTTPGHSRPIALSLRPLHLWTAYIILIVIAATLLNNGFSAMGQWLATLDLSLPTLDTDEPVVETPNPTPTATPTAAATLTNPAVTGKPVQVDIRVVEGASWLRVVADGQIVFEEILQPGAERNWSADESIVLRAGNAGGILVTFNNEELGVMGQPGEVKETVFQKPE